MINLKDQINENLNTGFRKNQSFGRVNRGVNEGKKITFKVDTSNDAEIEDGVLTIYYSYDDWDSERQAERDIEKLCKDKNDQMGEEIANSLEKAGIEADVDWKKGTWDVSGDIIVKFPCKLKSKNESRRNPRRSQRVNEGSLAILRNSVVDLYQEICDSESDGPEVIDQERLESLIPYRLISKHTLNFEDMFLRMTESELQPVYDYLNSLQ